MIAHTWVARGRRALALVVLALLAGAALPSGAGAVAGGDVLRPLGTDSPLCSRDAGAAARRACNGSGSLESEYGLDRFRFDVHIDAGVDNPSGNVPDALQYVGALAWTVSLWALRAVLGLLQTAFTLPLLDKAMPDAQRALERIHGGVLGEEWLTVALAVLGGWAAWRGVAQRQASRAAGGLLASVVMIAGALLVIARPDDTVGTVARAANATALAFFAGATAGPTGAQRPAQTLADADRRTFRSLVLYPWLALQFTDVDWALKPVPGTNKTRAEMWLSYPPGSETRDALYKAHKNPKSAAEQAGAERGARRDVALYAAFLGPEDEERVHIQRQGWTIQRLVLLALILVGQVGCIALLGWFAARLLLQAILTLVYLIATAGVLFAAAFGDAGRRLFATFALRFASALVAKVVYAVLLAVLLALAGVIAHLGVRSPNQLSWFVVWTISAVFWWGLLLRLEELLGWLSFTQSSGTSWSQLHHKQQLLAPKTVAGAAAPAVTAAGAAWRGTRAATGATAAVAYRAHQHDRQADQHAAQQLARQDLQEGTGGAVERLEARYQQTHTQLSAHDDASRKLPEMRRRQEKLERQRDQPARDPDTGRPTKRTPQQRAQLDGQIATLVTQRKRLEHKLLPRAQEGVARKFVETADRNLVEQGRRFTDAQLDLAVHEISDDLALEQTGHGPHGDDRLRRWRPGIPEDQLQALAPTERAELHRSVEETIERHRAQLAVTQVDENQQPTRQEVTSVLDLHDGEEILHRRREYLEHQQPDRPPLAERAIQRLRG